MHLIVWSKSRAGLPLIPIELSPNALRPQAWNIATLRNIPTRALIAIRGLTPKEIHSLGMSIIRLGIAAEEEVE